MLKKIIPFLIFITITFLSYCDFKDIASNDPQEVCCRSFGIGADLLECCESYDWEKEEDCSLPDNNDGGGKEVVDDIYCE